MFKTSIWTSATDCLDTISKVTDTYGRRCMAGAGLVSKPKKRVERFAYGFDSHRLPPLLLIVDL